MQSKKLWENGLWAVTPHGLECLYCDYYISTDRLWENEPNYDWGRHLAGKARIIAAPVPLYAFLEAWQMARILHARYMPEGRSVAIPDHDYLGERLVLERDMLHALKMGIVEAA